MFSLTDEQRLLVDATRRFLARSDPDRPGYWPTGAELGWTSVLGDPDRPGRFTDLALLAREFGRGVAAGPLVPVNVVVAALARDGTHEKLLDRLLDGSAVAAWVDGGPTLVGSRLDGAAAEPVEGAAEAGHLLVTTGDARTVLVPRDAPGVSVTPLRSLDPRRSYARVTFTAVPVAASDLVDADPAWLLDLAVLVQLAQTVGAMEWAFETTLRWTFDRYSFGRPLAAYQAIQHRTADLKMWLEASRAITADVARAFDTDSPARSELASAGKAYVGRYGPELLQECVQFHGGIGVTAEHDLHRYLRRVATDAATHGTPRDHAERLGRIVEAVGR